MIIKRRIVPLITLSVMVAVFHSSLLSADEPMAIPQNSQNIPGAMSHQAPGANMPGADPFQLLMNSREVQADLRLTETQLHHLSSISGNFRTQIRESSFRSEREIQQQTQSGQQLINRILDSAQIDRLRQIMLQLEGDCGILTDKRTLHDLEIEPDSPQFRQISTICQNLDARIRALANIANRTYPADSCMAMTVTWRQTRGIKDAAKKQIAQGMTEFQSNTLKAMKGRPLTGAFTKPPLCNTSPRS